MKSIRTHLIDASALAKLYLLEDASTTIRRYVSAHSVFAVTPYVIGEVLGILKRVTLRNDLTAEQYLAASEDVFGRIRTGSLQIEEQSLSVREIFDATERLATKYRIDLVDAHQIVTLKRSLFDSLAGDSRGILVTADKALADAAASEGLRVWNCLANDVP